MAEKITSGEGTQTDDQERTVVWFTDQGKSSTAVEGEVGEYVRVGT